MITKYTYGNPFQTDAVVQKFYSGKNGGTASV